ncbi:MAG: PD40 domain-containing protein [Acidobacteria bacterium]|nr:PD40 domain-containing protein [Acidobacteriota bacterium]
MRLRSLRMIPLLAGLLVFVGADLLPAVASAQTPFVPYFGKNRVKYDKFNWSIYTTDHFEIFYYPEIEQHLPRIAGYAESAYQHVSSELKHDLAFRIPLVLFKTQSEFQQQNISGDELPEGVLAFAEPGRDRMVLPIDEPSDQLYHTITHELTHVFEFDIIPRGLVSSGLPLWVDEGLADFMAGGWNPIDLMQVRDAAISDNVPRMSVLETEPLSGRLPYSMGHATFEFIQSRWGMEGLRQFLFSLRKSVIGGGESAYEEALKLKPEEFDDAFERYLKDRFKPFRDKEVPSDFGKDLAPRPGKSHFVSVISIEASPTGDLIAAVAGNRKDQELDIILISTKDGQVVSNLTKGFDQNRGFEYIATAGGLRGNLVPWISWAPVGDLIAYFARTEKKKTLIVQNVVTGKTVYRLELKAVDMPESPAFSPDGKRVAFSAIDKAVTDIYVVDLATGALTNVSKDSLADYSPTFSPDGRSIVYTVRISGNDKLFQLDLASGQKKQLTFGTHDDTGARFIDANTLVFTSTATDPNKPTTPEMARNGMVPNVWTLDLKTSTLSQWTDAATATLSPIPIKQNNTMKTAFISYYKGEYGIHMLDRPKAVATAQSSDFGAPGPVIDFQSPLTHTLVRKNIRHKRPFEKFMLDSRPGVSLGVTSGGNFYGGTDLTFTDVLGDKQMNFYASSMSTYRTFSFAYSNIERRFQYAVQGYSQDTFFYGQGVTAALYDPALAPFVDKDLSIGSRSQKGVTLFGIYPLNRYARVEVSGAYAHISESYDDETLNQLAGDFQQETYGTNLFRDGNMLPLGITLTRETTVFREFGPVAGSTQRLSYSAAPSVGSFLSQQTVDLEARRYLRLGSTGLLALRYRGFKSWGENPDFTYFGGNADLHGYDYLSLLGQKAFYANAQLRFPIITAMLTPIGQLGGVRGNFFFDIGGAGFNGTPFTISTRKDSSYTPIVDYTFNAFTGQITPIYGAEQPITGFRLVDARASYGFGLETFLFGYPLHFDWSWRTLFNKSWEDALFNLDGGSASFRKPKFSFWIGYDW